MVSVALCTYNGEKFLDQQLNSILNQSKPVNEIIICDDKSTDSTIKIIKEFQKQFPLIIKLHENFSSLGPIKNFEKAINLCSGDIIFLSDQDDIWINSKVEVIIREFEKSPMYEAIFTNAELVDENSTALGKTLWGTLNFDLETQKNWLIDIAFEEILYKRNKITGATLAIKRSLFDRAIPFPEIKGVWHDAWLGMHAAANHNLGLLNLCLIQYRIHSYQQVGIGNGTTLLEKNKKIDLKELLVNIKNHYEDVLYIIDEMNVKYPKLVKSDLQKNAIIGITWINFRLNLSRNILLRVFTIFKNIEIYKNVNKSFHRTIIRDMLAPAN
ncbi:MAG: glycosyltransferase family 2 protein [Janthinobacterium lividum]